MLQILQDIFLSSETEQPKFMQIPEVFLRLKNRDVTNNTSKGAQNIYDFYMLG